MSIPHVVITGRPNVGKSSLFNMLVQSRVSIVDAFPGVTRDRVARAFTHEDATFELVDTGGVGIVDSQGLEADVSRQIETAICEADLILFVVDARQGIMAADQDLARRLRALGRPVVVVCNKVDEPNFEPDAADFYRLGMGDPLMTSCSSRQGRLDLLDRIAEELAALPASPAEETPPGTGLAIVGKRNAGKSTLINHLCGKERVIVSDVAGTTRDSVDVTFERAGKTYTAIDTAGVRREKSIQNSVDFYSQARTRRAIRRADVVLFLLDASTEVARVDKKLCDLVVAEYKPVITVVNKWDLAVEKGATPEAYEAYLADHLSGMTFAPIACASALTGLNVASLLKLADELAAQSHERISTGELNRVVNELYARRAPRPKKGKIGKIYYATQVEVAPPTIMLFVNDRALFDSGYLRYVANHIRAQSPFSEVPVRLFLRPKGAPGSAHPGSGKEGPHARRSGR